MIKITIHEGRTTVAHKDTHAATLTGQCDRWEVEEHDPLAFDAVAMAGTELHDALTGLMVEVEARAKAIATTPHGGCGRRMDASPLGLARSFTRATPEGWEIVPFARAIGGSLELAETVLRGLEAKGQVERREVGGETRWRATGCAVDSSVGEGGGS